MPRLSGRQGTSACQSGARRNSNHVPTITYPTTVSSPAETDRDLVSTNVMAVADEPASPNHDVANDAVATRENPAVAGGFGAVADQGEMIGVEHDQISAQSRRERADRLGERLSSPFGGTFHQELAGMQRVRIRRNVDHVAALMEQALGVFDLAQLVGDAGTEIGVGSNPHRPSSRS